MVVDNEELANVDTGFVREVLAGNPEIDYRWTGGSCTTVGRIPVFPTNRVVDENDDFPRETVESKEIMSDTTALPSARRNVDRKKSCGAIVQDSFHKIVDTILIFNVFYHFQKPYVANSTQNRHETRTKL